MSVYTVYDISEMKSELLLKPAFLRFFPLLSVSNPIHTTGEKSKHFCDNPNVFSGILNSLTIWSC